MSLPRTVAEVLREHVTLEVEGIDRMYLNVYVPDLQREQGVVWFLRHHRGHPFASSALMDPISKAFVAAIEAFVKQQGVPLLSFAKGQRKDEIAAEYRAAFTATEGVLFVGRAQEKTPVFRTEKRTNPTTGKKYPWIVRSTAMVIIVTKGSKADAVSITVTEIPRAAIPPFLAIPAFVLFSDVGRGPHSPTSQSRGHPGELRQPAVRLPRTNPARHQPCQRRSTVEPCCDAADHRKRKGVNELGRRPGAASNVEADTPSPAPGSDPDLTPRDKGHPCDVRR
jgi:hypothetical protein